MQILASFFHDPFALGAFILNAAAFIGIAWTESFARHAEAAVSDSVPQCRIVTNFGLGVTNAAIALLLPLSTVTAATFAHERQWGLLNGRDMPWVAALLLLVGLRSLGAYAFHRLSHAVPLLWRIHRVHHTDRAFDLSTAFRSHPFEVLLIAPVAVGIVLATGASVRIVVATDTLLLLVAMWEHGALTVPAVVTNSLGLIVATPEQHRVHHNRRREHHDRNFGETLIMWDRLFGTYVDPATVPRDFGVGDSETEETYVRQLLSPLH